jgi:hypothetical protein
MKKICAPIALLAVGIQLTACGTPAEKEPAREKKTYDELKKAEWFLGRWENNSEEGNLSEIWTRESDSSFIAETYFEIGSDTVFREKVRLEEVDGKLVYRASVSDQNAGKQVSFGITHSSANKLVFENPKHDYPKKITYTMRNDSLVAVISGGSKQEVFAMGRVK